MCVIVASDVPVGHGAHVHVAAGDVPVHVFGVFAGAGHPGAGFDIWDKLPHAALPRGLPRRELLVRHCLWVRDETVVCAFHELQPQDEVVPGAYGPVPPYVCKVHDFAVDNEVRNVIDRPRHCASALVLPPLPVAGMHDTKRAHNVLYDVFCHSEFDLFISLLHLTKSGTASIRFSKYISCREQEIHVDADRSDELVPRVRGAPSVCVLAVDVALDAVEEVVHGGEVDERLRDGAHAL